MGHAQKAQTKYMNILAMRKNVYFAALPIMAHVQRALIRNISMDMVQINASIVEAPAQGRVLKVLMENMKDRYACYHYCMKKIIFKDKVQWQKYYHKTK